MRKRLLRIGILFLIFVVAVIGFGAFMNRDTTENTEEMKAASLPVINISYEDTVINQMYGYTQEMQDRYVRDSITPLETERTLTLAVETFGRELSGMTYEVRTADGETVVENGKISGFVTDGDYEKVDFTIANPILMNQEYSLCLTIQQNDQEIHYYTRLLQRSGLNISKYLEFVQNFYEKCTNKEAASDLAASLESDETASNSSFTEVNIHSSLAQVTWGDLNPKIYRKAIPTIEEINETTASIGMNYMISAENSAGETELYYVTEFYRMKYSQSKVMLLDFQRSAQQLFDGENSVLSNTGITLGVTDRNVEYVTNSNSDVTAFVQQGELWSYNGSADKLSRVFSFRDPENEDERNDHLAHDIKIVRVEENGDIDFVFYGYVNRGNHEGESGIGVYHYNSEMNAVEEQVFIPITKSFQFLNSDIDLLSYVNTQNMIFVYLDETLYQIDFQNKTYQVIQDDINPDCFVISKKQSRVAWMKEMDENGSSNITLMDFDTGEMKSIAAGAGEKIKALGFMNDDFVYGLAKDEQIFKDAVGNVTFAMYTVRIQNFDGTVIKEYAEENVWVTDVNIEEGLLELIRISSANDAYVAIANDHIMNNLQKNEETVTLKFTVTTPKETQVSMILQEPIEDKDPLVVYSRDRIHEESNTLKVDMNKPADQNTYYVYASGTLNSIWTKPKEAIVQADNVLGVVLNGSQQYVWERGNKVSETMITLTDVPQAILSGSIDEQELQTAMGTEATVMNLTGCTLDEVLYQVSQQRPIVVKFSNTETRVIVGYDQYNTWLYNPATQTTEPYGINDSTALFESMGNVYVSYIDTFEESQATE
ncbi:MAG: hypothetical protein PHC41_00725 [Lachnospiraceae bacterium]|nr:hypothetical protein [Lachnospiraceae bacterium]MDD3614728.1 hypothetical protein [Lachnospiraceae bacterium]